MQPIHVLLTFGGESSEHDISIISASNLLPHFRVEKYIVHLLYIKKSGEWLLCDSTKFKRGCDDVQALFASIEGFPVTLRSVYDATSRVELTSERLSSPLRFDVVCNMLHGTQGEDGNMQGLWGTFHVPYTGPGVIGAGIGFDKDVMKRLLKEADLPICKYLLYRPETVSPSDFDEIAKELGVPFIIKPANSGSSIGVHKISTITEWVDGIQDVFQYDDKLLVEEFVDGSELELYCLGVDHEIKTTIIRETIVGELVYSYEAKYVDERHVIKNVPAKLAEDVRCQVQEFGKKTYQTLEGQGLARVDFFYSKSGEVFVNEINTIPCIMSHANQPPLWELSGITHDELVDLMIKAAFQSHKKKKI